MIVFTYIYECINASSTIDNTYVTCVHIYVCINIHIYGYVTCVHIYVCINIHIYVCINISSYVHLC